MTDHEKDLERIRNFSMMDDDFFTACLNEENECTELILHIILNRTDLKVIKSQAQYFIKNLKGRSVRLDVYAKDTQGKRYNIEMQQASSGASARRARYYSSVLDANISTAGENYDDLPDSYVIFITERDVLKGNRPVYDIRRTVLASGEPFDDGSHIVYVNGSMQDDTPLGKLMFDLHCTDPNQMHYPALATKSRYFKEDEEGVRKMCKAMEEMRIEVENRTRAEESARIAQNMLEQSIPLDVIAKCTGFPLHELEKMAKSKKTASIPS